MSKQIISFKQQKLRVKTPQQLEQHLINKKLGIYALFGGFCLHFVIGAQFSWGSFSLYVISYFKQYNNYLTPQISPIISPLIQTVIGLIFRIGLNMAKTQGFLLTLIVGSLIIICGQLISSLTTNFLLFLTFYSICFGLGAGLTELLPFFVNARYFPNIKGLTTGLMYGGQGVGALTISLLLSKLTNPQNLSPDNKQFDGSNTIYYFPQSVSQNVPFAIQKISILYGIFLLVSIFLIRNKPQQYFKLKKYDNNQSQEVIVNGIKCSVVSQNDFERGTQSFDQKQNNYLLKCDQQNFFQQRTNFEKLALGKRSFSKSVSFIENLVLDQIDSDTDDSIITNIDEEEEEEKIINQSQNLQQMVITNEDLQQCSPKKGGKNLEDYWINEEIITDPKLCLKMTKFSSFLQEAQQEEKRFEQNNEEIYNSKINDKILDIPQQVPIRENLPCYFQINQNGIQNLQKLGLKIENQQINQIKIEDEELFSIVSTPENQIRYQPSFLRRSISQSLQIKANSFKKELFIRKQIIFPICQSIKEGVKSPNFLYMILIMYFTQILGFLLIINYKLYGFSNNINNDILLTILGSVASLLQGIFRLFWGIIYDYFGYKFTILIIIWLQICFILTIRFITHYFFLFGIYLCIMFITFGGIGVITASQSIQTFGIVHGLSIFSFLYFGGVMANYTQFLLIFLFEKFIGFNNIFYLLLIPLVISLYIIFFKYQDQFISAEKQYQIFKGVTIFNQDMQQKNYQQNNDKYQILLNEQDDE